MKVNCRSGGISRFLTILLSTALLAGGASSLCAAPLPGGTLNPLLIPKYVQPLVIPPQMPGSTVQPTDPNTAAPAAQVADYNITVRQFQQQILPGGQWNVVTGRTDPFPATTLWSYGLDEDAIPAGFVAPVPLDPASPIGLPGQGNTFNYPAFTVENQDSVPTSVRWINDLIDHNTGTFLPHLFAVDQTLMWANPPKANCINGAPDQTDCETHLIAPYTGPVPMVVHVHGSHVDPHSDGYPEAWWLPAAPGAMGIPATYAERGSVFTQADSTNAVPGSAFYNYRNDQAATTIWYHDHTLGMTRLNVYAGPAGFWLIRGGAHGDAFAQNSAGGAAVLPGPAPAVSTTPGVVNDPNFDPNYRNTIREVPIVIQDRSFNTDGSLFYPADRSFFDGFMGPYIGNSQDGLVDYLLATGPTDPTTGQPLGNSDISAIWNPEAFFNFMVVNGTTWPRYDVSDARYRLRLLNGCNSRTLNLALFTVTGPGPDVVLGTGDDVLGTEIPFYQIGGDQGFLPKVVKTSTGFTTPLPGDGTIPADVAAFAPDKALLLMSAERADVIVDFTGLPSGTRIRMINTAPDAPFGGFGDVPADPDTSGQVMDFVVDTALHTPADDLTTPVENLILPAPANLGAASNSRPLSLNELVSDQVCVNIDSVTGEIITLFSRPPGDLAFAADCLNTAPLNVGDTVDFAGPRKAELGLLIPDGLGNFVPVVKGWKDPVTEMPLFNSTEVWEFYNTTVDAHPIHVHLVAFQVVNRQDLDPLTLLPVPGTVTLPEPNEMGYKDTVVTYPGQVTRVKAHFDIAGLYVWHCHIVEHEDNEMMRPFTVTDSNSPPLTPTLVSPSGTIASTTPTLTWNAVNSASDYVVATYVNGVRSDVPYTALAAGCSEGAGLCTVTLANPLANGDIVTWLVRATNAAGSSGWSSYLRFTVGILPATQTLVSPSGTIVTTTPTYTWNADTAATSYVMAAYLNGVRTDTTYTATEAGCAAGTGTCSVTPATALANGDKVTWLVRATNIAGSSAWSAYLKFTVGIIPATPTLIGPSGTIATTTPIYSWNAVPEATSYVMATYVNGVRSDLSITAVDAGCASGTGTCSFAVSPVDALTSGDNVTWLMRAVNLAGSSSWSSYLKFLVQ